MLNSSTRLGACIHTQSPSAQTQSATPSHNTHACSEALKQPTHPTTASSPLTTQARAHARTHTRAHAGKQHSQKSASSLTPQHTHARTHTHRERAQLHPALQATSSDTHCLSHHNTHTCAGHEDNSTPHSSAEAATREGAFDLGLSEADAESTLHDSHANSQQLDDGLSSLPSYGAPSQTGEGNDGHGIALVVDAEVTSYLMMGALSPGLKRHSVTLFEGACMGVVCAMCVRIVLGCVCCVRSGSV